MNITGKEVLVTWIKDDFFLILFSDEKINDQGRIDISYLFVDLQEDVIFHGDDFQVPRYRINDTRYKINENMIYELLGFLSLQPGDVDSEWFNCYTEKQLEWVESWRVDELQMIVSEYEEQNGG